MVAEAPRRYIAGHVFDFNGRCVSGDCKIKLSEILSATAENLNQEGWAHTGKLNQPELAQIIEERDRIWRAHDGSRSGT